MQIIVAGCGKVGRTLVEQLSKEGHSVTVIDTNKEVINSVISQYDVMGVEGNACSHLVQQEAGVKKADLFIAVAGSDELNLLCCLIAKKTGNCHTIARVRNPIYSQEIDVIREELGLSMTVNPEYAAAMEIARVFRFPSAIKIETFAKGRVELLKFKIQPGSPLHEFMLMNIGARLHCDVLVCTVERGNEVIIPRGDFVLKENDIVSIVASPKNASEFFKRIGVETNQVKNAMLVGGGEITYYLTGILLSMGIEVTIIEKDLKRCEELNDLLPGAVIIHGDGVDQTLLAEEGIENTEGFAALTNIDEENIMLSLFAKSRSEAKLITKINRITFDEVVNSLDLGSIICPKSVTAENIIRYVRAMQGTIGSNVETLYRLIEDKAEALEFRVQAKTKISDIPLEKLNIKSGILIACIIRKGKIITPKGQDCIRDKDTVIVVTTDTHLSDLDDILQE